MTTTDDRPKTTTDDRTRLRACRRLARSFPDKTSHERLKMISEIASGKAEPRMKKTKLSSDGMERITAGQASRSQGNAHDRIERRRLEDEAEAEKKRKKRGTRNRQETSGHDRMTGS